MGKSKWKWEEVPSRLVLSIFIRLSPTCCHVHFCKSEKAKSEKTKTKLTKRKKYIWYLLPYTIPYTIYLNKIAHCCNTLKKPCTLSGAIDIKIVAIITPLPMAVNNRGILIAVFSLFGLYIFVYLSNLLFHYPLYDLAVRACGIK